MNNLRINEALNIFSLGEHVICDAWWVLYDAIENIWPWKSWSRSILLSNFLTGLHRSDNVESPPKAMTKTVLTPCTYYS